MEFQTLNLDPRVMAGIASAGYSTPTPIQEQAIPAVIQGRDVMGLAQTGTGKTAAFALPILNRLMRGGRRHVRALVIAPTRELAEQTYEAFSSLGGKTGLRSVAVYGGVGMNPQVERLRRGVEIVVACPGRLLDHVGQMTIDLSRVEVLVIDEADRMFDMGFLPDIRRILRHVPAKRQTLLFSATMPDEIRHLAKDVLTDPVTVQVGITAPAVTVSHALYPVGQHLKTPLLVELLQRADTESVLVFTRTKHRAKRLGEQLVKSGFRATSLQGNLSQSRRQAAMNGFRNGTFQILVATDIAARGIDVSQISHVINYDVPGTADDYIHRIGRTGRAARSGDAYTLVTPEDTSIVRAIEQVLGSTIERRRLPDFNYGVPPEPERKTAFPSTVRSFSPGRRPGGPRKVRGAGAGREMPQASWRGTERKASAGRT